MSDISGYVKERLDGQIEWHSKKARLNKDRYHLFQVIVLVSGAIVPFVNVLGLGDLVTRIITSALGAVVSVTTGVTQLKKYQENWTLYRTNAELLKKEKYFFNNDAGVYAGLDSPMKNKLLVERVESIVSAETSKYFALHETSGKGGPSQ